MHHSDPACARHGVDRGQVDISAAVIRIFERLGWATKVRWPTPARLDSRRRCPERGEPEPALQSGGRLTGAGHAGCRRCPPAVTGSDDGHRWIAISYCSGRRAARRPGDRP